MSFFRNVQDLGIWRAGKVYTFEVNNNEMPAVPTTKPSADYEWIWTNYENYWFSHGAWHNAVPQHYVGEGWWDPPWDWGWEFEDVPRCSWPKWMDVDGVWKNVWQDIGLGWDNPRTGGGYLGIGSHWTATRRQGTFLVTPTCIPVSLTQNFALIAQGDTLKQSCGLEYKPESSDGIITPRYAFTRNDIDLQTYVDGFVVIKKEELEDGWIKYYVQVAANSPTGEFWFKGKTYHITPEGGFPT